MPCFCQTGFDACGFLSPRNPVSAKHALFNNIFLMHRNLSIAYSKTNRMFGLLPIKLSNICVRTCRHTKPTSDAFIVILFYDASFFILVRCPNRTHIYASRILTVLTGKRYILFFQLRENSGRCIHAITTVKYKYLVAFKRRNRTA